MEAGNWGEKTVEELANFISIEMPELSGFNRVGLYRMKQFYETCSNTKIVSPLVIQLQNADNKDYINMSELGTKFNKNKFIQKMYELGTQNQEHNEEVIKQNLLAKISWSKHRLILSKTKSDKEKIYYILLSIKEKYSSTELERILNSETYQRNIHSNNFFDFFNLSIN